MAKTRTQVNETKKANVDERKYKAFEMRKNGHSYRWIADELGVHYTTVRNDIKNVLEVLKEETLDEAKEYRSIQVNRLMGILITHHPIASDPNHKDYQKSTEIILKTEAMLMKLMGTEELPIQRVENNLGSGFTIEYVGCTQPIELPSPPPDEDAQ